MLSRRQPRAGAAPAVLDRRAGDAAEDVRARSTKGRVNPEPVIEIVDIRNAFPHRPLMNHTTSNGQTATSSWTEVFRGRFGVYTLLLNIGILFFAVDNFLINTLMPSIVADIGGVAFYAWAMMLYLVGSIMGAASYGPLRARIGGRRSLARRRRRILARRARLLDRCGDRRTAGGAALSGHRRRPDPRRSNGFHQRLVRAGSCVDTRSR